ncbi:MAG: hypothetical protein KJO07_13570 [Deltaproteobacteria bacterium]|nr:hypothetical protein [Deltaproteobacteria bacterium]
MSYLRAVVVVGLIAGCYSPSFSEGVECGPDGACPTGQDCIDGVCRTASQVPDAGEASCPNENALLFTPSNFDVCDIEEDPPTLALTTAATPLDTDAETLGGQPVGQVVTMADGTEALLVSARSFSLAEDTFLDVSGSRPLIIASLADIEIDGSIIATGNGTVVGAGGNPAACGAEAGTGAAGAAATGGFIGGGGGGFAFVGGIGAVGPPAAPESPAAGGAINGSNELVPLRGGCSGGTGGGGRGGPGGGGGGAIQLVAAGSVRIGPKGRINVAGGGGLGGGLGPGIEVIAGDGGGGGGSGGGILLEAGLSVVLEADSPNALESVLTAAGGGGGSGAVNTEAGESATNGGTLGPGPGGTAQGPGGDPSSGAGGAGGGGALNDAGEPGLNGVGTAGIGGGGGGGGAGRIVLRSSEVTTDGTTFPLPTLSGL